MANKNILCGDEITIEIELTLGQMLQHALKPHGDKILQVDAATGEELSARILLESASRLCYWLQSHGYHLGDTIAICSENRFEFTIVFCSALMLGITLNPINPDYTTGEHRHVLNISKPKLVFTSLKSHQTVVETINNCEFDTKVVLFDGYVADSKTITTLPMIMRENNHYQDFMPPKINVYENIAIIMCSSGTTGLPKGAMITQYNILAALSIMKKSAMRVAKVQGMDIISGVVPFYHSMGLLMQFMNLMLGNKLVIIRKFIFNNFLEAIQNHKITTLIVPPTIIRMLCTSKEVNNYDLSSLTTVRSSAALLTADLQAQIFNKFNLKESMQGYGLTEVTLGVLLPPTTNKYGSVGTIVPGMKAKVIDETGRALGPYEEGELCFSGPLIMKGYAGDRESTARTVDSDNWLHSGDVGYYDNEGYFYIVDRLKELIKYKGYQVAPAELEDILLSHPAVADAAVIGLPDDLAGELPLGFVVLKPGARKPFISELLQFVNEKVSPQKKLRGGIRYIESIPRNMLGKILRRVLRNMLKNSKL